jgi:hypothetical protein
MPEARILYEAKLVRLALERTEQRFGPFELAVDRQLRSQERLARDITNDQTVHILSGPGWSSSAPDPTGIDMRVIQVPLAKGLLGYRQCIIRRQDETTFASIDSLSALKTFSVGLGDDWLDKDIFDHNGFTTVEAPDIEKLYYMLKRGRFDCLPLGIGEAEGSLAEHNAEGELMIADDLLFFYPLPVLVQVGGRDSELAQRIEQGLALMQQDGSFDAVFWAHQGGTIEQIRSPGNRVFRLHNPYIADELRHLGLEFLDVKPPLDVPLQ